MVLYKLEKNLKACVWDDCSNAQIRAYLNLIWNRGEREVTELRRLLRKYLAFAMDCKTWSFSQNEWNDCARQMDTSFILLSFLNAKLNFRHFEFEVMEMPRNDKEWETYKVKTDIFLKPETRAGQSDSTSIRERLGTVALALTAAAGVGQCASRARED